MNLAKKTRRTVLIGLLLSAVTLLTFWPQTGHDFINYDDGPFVTQNPNVASGLSWANTGWAFRTGFGGNWQPLTWLSHMLDAQLFGLKPAWHHLTSLLFHLANTVLLFLLLQSLTGAPWRSALVAALFALHPLHVESVAWVAERKDVLSAFFFMATLLTYSRYAEARSLESKVQSLESEVQGQEPEVSTHPPALEITPPISRFTFHVPRFDVPSSIFYLLALAFFALGLMSKAMLVTVPFVLLLLDYWPLSRLQLKTQDSKLKTFPALLLEKLPFLALSATSCVVTFATQRTSDSVFPLAYLSLTERATNALVACATYLRQMFWPAGLAVFYPLPNTLPVGTVVLAGAVLLGITVWAIGFARRRPHRVVGWFWFLGMLAPVIGLVQVGLQQRADRYTYLPLIGLFILLVWEVSDALSRWRLPRIVCGAVTGLALLCCAAWTRAQLRYWQNSETVFRHAIAVTKDNWLAHYNLAEALSDPGRRKEAVAEYDRALAIHPRFARAHNNLGNLLLLRGQVDEAIAHWQQALEIEPGLAGGHLNLGIVLLGKGQVDEAIAHLERALAIDPGLANAHNSLGHAMLRKGRPADALAHFREAVRLRPDFARAHCNLAAALLRQGQFAEALTHYQAAVAAQPANPAVLSSVAWVLATCPEPSVRNGPRAVELAEQARRLPSGENPAVLGTLAAAYAEAGRFPEAVATAQHARELIAAQGNAPQAEALRAQLQSYQAGSPFRDPSFVGQTKTTPGS
jgi:tetratricopeptide (TPR) repeat protein